VTRLPASFRVGGRQIGGGAPCYVIAEAGANHNRDLGLAKALVETAAQAGADAVKFQTYTGTDVYSRFTPRFEYLHDERSPADVLDAIALPREWHEPLAAHARSLGIDWFSSPFDHRAIAELVAVGVPMLKIASFELVDLPLIRAAAATGLPLILSTGMASYGEIEEALRTVTDAGGTAVALLRCASLYPAPPQLLNLRAIGTLRRVFGTPAGLSDHTTGIAAAAGAAALGMDVLEKHVTLDRAMEGPDHRFALEPDELAAMVRGVREVEAAMGDGILRGPSVEERREMYSLARRSVHAATTIAAGTVISEDMLTVKRPGYGVMARDIPLLVGRVARRQIPADTTVTWDLV
jgi:sialic acid synthase SpsE